MICIESPCLLSPFFFYVFAHPRHLHSFPTRRSSDLPAGLAPRVLGHVGALPGAALRRPRRDRKSTRLNSSHTVISYAVFCLKKKMIGKKMAAVVTETSNSEREFAGKLEQTKPDTSGQ